MLPGISTGDKQIRALYRQQRRLDAAIEVFESAVTIGAACLPEKVEALIESRGTGQTIAPSYWPANTWEPVIWGSGKRSVSRVELNCLRAQERALSESSIRNLEATIEGAGAEQTETSGVTREREGRYQLLAGDGLPWTSVVYYWKLKVRDLGGKMPKNSGLKPGEAAPHSGQYQVIGPRGGKGSEITAIKGKPLPPTSVKGATYTFVDATKNKSGRG